MVSFITIKGSYKEDTGERSIPGGQQKLTKQWPARGIAALQISNTTIN